MVDTEEITDQIETKKSISSKQKQYIKYTDIHTPNNKEDEKYTNIGDFYQMLALFFGLITYFYRFKLTAWVCLLIFYSSIINMKHEDQFT